MNHRNQKLKNEDKNYGQELVFYLRQKIWNIYAAIRGTYRWHCNTTMYGFIKKFKYTFQQISRRFYVNEPTSGWVHCCYSTDHNRNQPLRAYREDGKVIYKPWLE